MSVNMLMTMATIITPMPETRPTRSLFIIFDLLTSGF
jgi:hypothetical protein